MQLLKKGAKGAAVKFLQQRLCANGYVVKIDGDFGEKTETAVEQFQMGHNLTVDGIVGGQTWTALGGSPPTDVVLDAKADLLKRMEAAVKQSGLPTAVGVEKIVHVLAEAISCLGEKEIPNGSNGGPELAHILGGNGMPISEYYTYWGVTDPEVIQFMPPWCAIFVSWALKTGLDAPSWGATPFGHYFGGAQQIEDWAEKEGVAYPASVDGCEFRNVKPGAIFTMGRRGSGSDASSSAKAGHVGFVICDDDEYVITIEGNCGNKVASSRRKKVDLMSFIYWWEVA